MARKSDSSVTGNYKNLNNNPSGEIQLSSPKKSDITFLTQKGSQLEQEITELPQETLALRA
jgi:hypothetical protein